MNLIFEIVMAILDMLNKQLDKKAASLQRQGAPSIDPESRGDLRPSPPLSELTVPKPASQLSVQQITTIVVVLVAVVALVAAVTAWAIGATSD